MRLSRVVAGLPLVYCRRLAICGEARWRHHCVSTCTPYSLTPYYYHLSTKVLYLTGKGREGELPISELPELPRTYSKLHEGTWSLSKVSWVSSFHLSASIAQRERSRQGRAGQDGGNEALRHPSSIGESQIPRRTHSMAAETPGSASSVESQPRKPRKRDLFLGEADPPPQSIGCAAKR